MGGSERIAFAVAAGVVFYGLLAPFLAMGALVLVFARNADYLKSQPYSRTTVVGRTNHRRRQATRG
jgi:hypothetical protein